MNRRTLLTGAAALAVTPVATRAQGAPTRVVFWHSMTGTLGDEVNRLATLFNASQKDYAVAAVFKGTYAETLTAAIAAYRAG